MDASKLGTVRRGRRRLQITYGGKPLYWFVKDKAPGQVKGNITDKWGKWSTVVTVKASRAPARAATTSAGTGGVVLLGP